jgi:hypothetical protein
MLTDNKSRNSISFKAIAITLVCLFAANNISWAESACYNSAKTSTLAVNSRLKPFSEKHGLDFQNTVTATYIAKELKGLVKANELRDSHIARFNKQFPNGDVEIEREIKTGIFRSTKKEYKYAVFHFRRERPETVIHALFVDDLTDAERAELGIKDDEKGHLDQPGLEGVWFINPGTLQRSLPPFVAKAISPQKEMMVAVNLADLGAEIQDGKIIYRDSLRKAEELLPILAESGVGKVYFYGGLYKMSETSKQLHDNPAHNDDLRAMVSGKSVVLYGSYPTKHETIDGIEFKDGFGNAFSVYDMRIFNPDLSDGNEEHTREQFGRVVERSHQLGMKVVSDFVPWLSPDAINETNYRSMHYKEIGDAANNTFRSISETEKLHWIKRLLVYPENYGYFAVRITENGLERVILVKHFFSGFGNTYNGDQAEPNLRDENIQQYYIISMKSLIDLGVDEVRVDMADRLLQNIPDDEEPLFRVIEAAKAYANSIGREIEFNMETYDDGARKRLFRLGAARSYSDALFRSYWDIIHGNKHAADIKDAVWQVLWAEPRPLVYPSNFDETSLAAIGGNPEAFAMLLMTLSHLRKLHIMFDLRDWLGHRGHVIPIVGGSPEENGMSRHLFVTAEELKTRTDPILFKDAVKYAPFRKVAQDLHDAVGAKEERWIDTAETSNPDSLFPIFWKTETGDWTLVLLNLRNNATSMKVNVTLPQKLVQGFGSAAIEVKNDLEAGAAASIAGNTISDIEFRPGEGYKIFTISKAGQPPTPVVPDTNFERAVRLVRSSQTSWVGFMDMAKANLKNSLYGRNATDDLIAKNLSIAERELAKVGTDTAVFKIAGDEIGFVLPSRLSKTQVMAILLDLQKTLGNELGKIYAPYMPVGCILAENNGEDARSILEKGLQYAEIAQRLAKEKKDGIIDLIRINEKFVPPAVRPETVSMVMLTQEDKIKKARENIRRSVQRLDGTYEMEDIYPSLKREHLWQIINDAKFQNEPGVYLIRGPPDSFYVIRACTGDRIQIIKIESEYRPENDEMEDKFESILQKSERTSYTRGDYSFKCAQDSFDHSFGNDIIMLENLGIYEAFKPGTAILTEKEISDALDNVEKFVNSHTVKSGFTVVSYASTASTNELEDGSKTFMPVIERMAEAKKTAQGSKVLTPSFYDENRQLILLEIEVIRNKAKDAAKERLKEENDILARSFARLSASLGQEDEANRIHDENLKYTPAITQNTIICHIITDSILPIKQRPILQDLEKHMAGAGYTEKVVQLKISDPADFMEELKKVMAAKAKEYEGYNIQFDVACPGTEYVNMVLNSGLGAKALAFQPCSETEIGVVQVEAIILALRALQLDSKTDKIEALREAYKFLMGKDLTAEELAGFKTLNDFLRKITFTLPVTKVDYNNIEKLNRLIRENIESAA